MRTEFRKKTKQKPHSRSKPLEFQGAGLGRPEYCFGGNLLKNSNAKTKRPVASKLPIHLVLRSRKSVLRTPKAFGKVNGQVQRSAKRHGVRIYQFANVGNHLHILIKLPRATVWAAFVRELSGRVAQIAQGLGGQEKGRKFWLQRPFTRIVRGWREAFQTVKEYVGLNELEANGFINRHETRALKELRLVFAVDG